MSERLERYREELAAVEAELQERGPMAHLVAWQVLSRPGLEAKRDRLAQAITMLEGEA
jgi:hypothetical protein